MKRKQLTFDEKLAKFRKMIFAKYNFNEIKTYEQLLGALGVSSYGYNEEQLSKPVNREELVATLDAHIWRLKHYQFNYGVEAVLTKPNTLKDIPNVDLAKEQDKVKQLKKDADFDEKHKQEQAAIYKPAFPYHPKQKATLYSKQNDAAKALLENLVLHNMQGQLLLAAAGKGKTFILGALIRRIIDLKWLESKSMAPWKIIYVTKASIVTQTERVLRNHFGIDTDIECLVTNIDKLRSSWGEMFIKWDTVVENGSAHVKPVWKKAIHPCLFILDESQSAKNEDSLQSKVFQAVNDITDSPVYVISASATPFTKVSEAKVFAVSTRIPYRPWGAASELPLNNRTWSQFSRDVAAPSKPDIHNEAAIGRLVDRLLPYIVDVKGMRSQFDAKNRVSIIQFRNATEKKFYDDAWNRYEKEKAKLLSYTGENAGQTGFALLATFTKFREAAEVTRAEYIADYLHDAYINGYAGVAACCFKTTISKVVEVLMSKHGYNRNDISLIWGGMLKKKNVKKRKIDTMTEKQISDFKNIALLTGMSQEEMDSMLFDIETTVEEKVNQDIDPKLRLGSQSQDERQREIDRFQSGKTKFCIFTFKSGGVGLSLHHTDEMTTYKVKRKDSGYYQEDDIINCPTRPRKTILTPTYSAMEMVQGLGRAPRLTSMSDTDQDIVFYEGTIEERVAATVSRKLKCLRRVVRQRESWEDIILSEHSTKELETLEEIPQDEFAPDDDEDNTNLDVDDEDED